MTPSFRLAAICLLTLSAGCQAPLSSGVLARMVLGQSGLVPDALPTDAPASVVTSEPSGGTSESSGANGLQRLPPRKSPNPTPTPSASTASDSASQAPDATVDGLVVDLADQPVSGATVRTSDGRQAVTDTDGTFSLSGTYPADGLFSASHPDYVASAVAGLPSDAPLTLHMQPRTEGGEEESNVQPDRLFVVRGHILDPAGHPAEDVWVTIGDGHGASAVPVQTDASGLFELSVSAPLPRLADATVLAVGPTGMAVMGGLNATPSTPFLNFNPNDANLSPLVLHPITQTVAIAVDATPGGTDAARTVELAAANGVRLSLDASGPTFSWAPQAGLTATLRVEATNGDMGLASEYVHVLAPTETSISDTLLAPPTFQATPALTPGESLGWNALAGVDGYQLTLSGQLASGPLWEAFTATPGLSLSIADALPSGPYTLALTAWQGTGYAPRTVAATGPRALRLPPPAAGYKRSTRKLSVTRP